MYAQRLVIRDLIGTQPWRSRGALGERPSRPPPASGGGPVRGGERGGDQSGEAPLPNRMSARRNTRCTMCVILHTTYFILHATRCNGAPHRRSSPRRVGCYSQPSDCNDPSIAGSDAIRQRLRRAFSLKDRPCGAPLMNERTM
eukprot:9199258-Pyramimonas_sp.AAC.1